jgi:hypothetical protein
MGQDFSGSYTVTSRNPLLHDGATNATWSPRFEANGATPYRYRVVGAALDGSLATANFRELPFFSTTFVNRDNPGYPLMALFLVRADRGLKKELQVGAGLR